MSFQRNIRFNVTVGDPQVLPVSNQSSVTSRGVTLTFDVPVPVGYFHTGEPFIVSDRPFQIIASSPASADRDANGHIAYGVMQDPYIQGEQGFDGYLNVTSGPGLNVSGTPYNDALNVDPSKPGGSAISVSFGQETSLVKAIRRSDISDGEHWTIMDDYVHFHVLAAAPREGEYPPSPSALTKTPLLRQSDIDTRVFRSQTFAGPWNRTYASASVNIPPVTVDYGATGEKQRRFRYGNGVASNYSRDTAQEIAHYLLLLHENGALTSEQRVTIFDRIAIEYIQLKGLASRGWGQLASVTPGGGGAGAGQLGSYHPWVYYGALMFGEQAGLTLAHAMRTSMDGNGYWGAATEVGTAAVGKSGNSGQTFFDEHVGQPFMISDEWSSERFTRYGRIAGTISRWEHLAVLFLNTSNRLGVDGERAVLKGGGLDPTNPAAAALAYCDTERAFTYNDTGNEWRDLWDQVAAFRSNGTWQGVPDQIVTDEGEFPQAFSATFDGFRANFTGFNVATEPVTRRDLRYSLDGLQWVEVQDVAEDATLTGLMQGVLHYVGARQVSASGPGFWSANFPTDQNSTTPRNVITTTGTPANAAPSFAVDPAILTTRFPNWNQSLGNSRELSGALTVNDLELIAGDGYQSGSVFPAPTYTYQWQRSDTGSGGWANIAGATDKTYFRQAADAEKFIRCEITATNSQGSVAAFTPVVEAPAIATPPAGTLIDTTFNGAFAVDYASELASLTSPEGATPIHDPTRLWPEIPEASVGAIWGDKTGARPTVEFDISRAATASTNYEATFRFYVVDPLETTGNPVRLARLQVKDGTGAILLEASSQDNFILDENGDRLTVVHNNGNRQVVELVGTFPFTTGSNTALTINLRHNSNVGGTNKGDLFLHSLRVREV